MDRTCQGSIPRQPRVEISKMRLRLLFRRIRREAQPIVEHQPAERPRRRGAGLPAQSTEGVIESRLADVGIERFVYDLRSAVANRREPLHGPTLGPTDRGQVVAEQACGDPLFVSGLDGSRREVDDACRTRSVFDGKAPGIYVDSVDGRRVKGADEVLKVLEMEGIGEGNAIELNE